MGGGLYSSSRRAYNVSNNESYMAFGANISPEKVFKARSINNAMNPYGVDIRESRDSAEHPNSLAIIFALDVTGSMGSIPHYLVKEGLPKVMENLVGSNVKDPQILFIGIGDHECDNAPLQIGQFESSDELLDKWLTDLWIEGRGGGNDGESYLLAWYFAGKHTAIDCLEKRGQKGFLFTIGDEPCLKSIPQKNLKDIMGKGQYDNTDAPMLLDKAHEKYHVYHIHVRQGSNGNRQEVIDGWKQLMGNNLIILDNYKNDLSKIIADKINQNVATKHTISPISPATEILL